MSAFEINMKLSFEGPFWLINLLDGVLAPDNTKKFILKQWIQENEKNTSIANLFFSFTPTLSIESILTTIEDMFECITLILRLLTYFIDFNLFLI